MAETDTNGLGFENLTLEDVATRHRKERKDLQSKIQELKKNAPKSDKKKRKEAMETIARMESEMDKRHTDEMKSASSVKVIKQSEEIIEPHQDDNQTEVEEEVEKRVSKAQKRRDKKEKEARKLQEDIRAAESEALLAPSPKNLELRNIQAKLKERQLALHQISSDGDCLFNAVRHQLQLNGLPSHSINELRSECANFIRAHKDELICYMTNPQTGDLLNDEEFDNYCQAVCSTPAWGGQIELKALSATLKVPIEVLQAEGPPTIQGGNEFAKPNLIITYHRHMYSLGEHYNSTIPRTQANVEDDDLN